MWALVNRRRRVNQKRIRRLWRRQRRQVRRTVRKRPRYGQPARVSAAYPGHIWTYDFVEDAVADRTPCAS
jgi:putative transposase